ncbi:MAG: ankyrin repeat domain-containing protein, partial [Luteimonas sp.]
MPELRRPDRYIVAAVLAGLLLAALTGLGGVPAALAGWLAQPAFALAVSGWRGSRAVGDRPRAAHDALTLTVLWGAGLALMALLIAWPLLALQQSGSLGATIGLSLAAGIGVLGLWRIWPLWHAIEREGGALQARWRELDHVDIGAWRGLMVALWIAMIGAAVTLLAWPALLEPSARWITASVFALASPLLHWALQRTPAPRALNLWDTLEDHGDDIAADVRAAEAGDQSRIAADENLEHALYAAARRGRVDRALALLAAGADPHAQPPADDRDQRSVPLLAAVLPDLRLLRALIGQGAQVNEAHAGMTPLLAATRDSWHGRPEAVMTLLANGADPRAVDAAGNTPLHHAARSTDPGVAALLRDAAAEIDALNHEGQTPLAIACTAGNWRLARFLLERGAQPEPAGGQPTLLAAAAGDEDDPAGVQLLLKHKARIDARDARGRSALHEAALAGHVDIADALLAAGADLHARDANQRTPFLEAAQSGSLPLLERFAEARPDFAAADADGGNALLLAIASGRATPAVMRRLLELGADPDHVDRDGRRAIDRAAESGRWAIVGALDPSYPLPASVRADNDQVEGDRDAPADRSPLTLLAEALQDGRSEGRDALAKLLTAQELGGLLFDATAAEHVTWLLAAGADADVRDSGGRTPMVAALARGPAALPALHALLQRAVSPAGGGGMSRFLAACVQAESGAPVLERTALDLLDRGADPFVTSPSGEPALMLAVRLDWTELTGRLIACGVDADARDSHGMTALHLAAALGREDTLKQLVVRGASPEVRAADGQTPLGVALSSGR